jgi:hypothetical protein
MTSVSLRENPEAQHRVGNYPPRVPKIVAYAFFYDVQRGFRQFDVVHSGISAHGGKVQERTCLETTLPEPPVGLKKPSQRHSKNSNELIKYLR